MGEFLELLGGLPGSRRKLRGKRGGRISGISGAYLRKHIRRGLSLPSGKLVAAGRNSATVGYGKTVRPEAVPPDRRGN